MDISSTDHIFGECCKLCLVPLSIVFECNRKKKTKIKKKNESLLEVFVGEIFIRRNTETKLIVWVMTKVKPLLTRLLTKVISHFAFLYYFAFIVPYWHLEINRNWRALAILSFSIKSKLVHKFVIFYRDNSKGSVASCCWLGFVVFCS